MPSFVSIYNNIITTLQNDSGLTAFCNAKWGKSQKVIKAFKRRIEISKSDLPVILVTRPSVEKEFRIDSREYKHTVRLYFGFNQEDREVANEEGIEYEEYIEQALLADRNRGDTTAFCIDTDISRAANDEGEYHPVYFGVAEVEILTIT